MKKSYKSIVLSAILLGCFTPIGYAIHCIDGIHKTCSQAYCECWRKSQAQCGNFKAWTVCQGTAQVTEYVADNDFGDFSTDAITNGISCGTLKFKNQNCTWNASLNRCECPEIDTELGWDSFGASCSRFNFPNDCPN